MIRKLLGFLAVALLIASSASADTGGTGVNQANGAITTQDVATTGVCTAASCVQLALNGNAEWALQITGTWTGTITFQESVDGQNWININGRLNGTSNTTLATSTTGTACGTLCYYRGNSAGARYIRADATAAMTGTANVLILVSTVPGAVFLNGSIPAGTNSIGTVGLNTGANTIGNLGGASYAYFDNTRCSINGAAATALTAGNSCLVKSGAGVILGFEYLGTSAMTAGQLGQCIDAANVMNTTFTYPNPALNALLNAQMPAGILPNFPANGVAFTTGLTCADNAATSGILVFFR